MNLLLFVFFVLPLATILLAIVLQKILRSPILVAITFFAIFLIVAFVAFSDMLAEAIIAVLIYTIIAYITASIVHLIKRCFCSKVNLASNLIGVLQNNNIETRSNCSCENDNGNTENNLLRISCSCGNANDLNNENTVMMNRNNMQRRCYRRW